MVDGLEIEKVLCRVYLPVKVTDPIELRFHPTREQAQILEHSLWACRQRLTSRRSHSTGPPADALKDALTWRRDRRLAKGFSPPFRAGGSRGRVAGRRSVSRGCRKGLYPSPKIYASVRPRRVLSRRGRRGLCPRGTRPTSWRRK